MLLKKWWELGRASAIHTSQPNFALYGSITKLTLLGSGETAMMIREAPTVMQNAPTVIREAL